MALNAFWLKTIALVTMVIDHVGLFFYPQLYFLRMLGRISFPIFAWLIAGGARHTRSINVYLGRLLACAVLTQPFYLIARQQVNPVFYGFNPLFDLFLGLLAIKGVSQAKDVKTKTAVVAVAGLAAQAFGVDYGAMGVLSVVFFYIFSGNFKYSAAAQFFIYTAPYLAVVIPPYLVKGLPMVDIRYYNEPLALFSLFLIFLYNGQQGPKLKYFFYFFYPFQFIAAAALRFFLG